MYDTSIENFISFCDDMQIANEKLETNILDKTLAKTMTLYHGSPKELTTISPNSVNMGTRLSRVRKSSFWTKSFDYAVVWALDWVAMRYNIPYYHNIEENHFVVPNWICEVKSMERAMPIDELMLESLQKDPVYVYKAEVPTKFIGRGQLPIDEYTVDKPINKFEKIVITPQIAKDYIKVTSTENFDMEITKKRGLIKKENVSLLEKVVFHNPDNILNNRSKYSKII